MAESQVGVFNKALRWLGERKVITVSDPGPMTRYLNDEWADALAFVLRDGYWNHAMREQQIAADTNRAPAFGFQYCFTKPADWVRTYQFSDNDQYEPLLWRFRDQGGVWFADCSTVYIRFVSNSADYGANMALWPVSFAEYLGIYLAQLCSMRNKQSEEKLEFLRKETKKVRMQALAADATDQPPGKIPYGTWVRSRAPRGGIVPFGNPLPGELD